MKKTHALSLSTTSPTRPTPLPLRIAATLLLALTALTPVCALADEGPASDVVSMASETVAVAHDTDLGSWSGSATVELSGACLAAHVANKDASAQFMAEGLTVVAPRGDFEAVRAGELVGDNIVVVGADTVSEDVAYPITLQCEEGITATPSCVEAMPGECVTVTVQAGMALRRRLGDGWETRYCPAVRAHNVQIRERFSMGKTASYCFTMPNQPVTLVGFLKDR